MKQLSNLTKRMSFVLALALVFSCSMKEEQITKNGEAIDLSSSNTANCYIVSDAGLYSFHAVIGNSMESVGQIASAEVLWESFGTDVAPEVGDLIKNVRINGDNIVFEASGRKGNAVIAARDIFLNILWSWHIWLTDKPEDQVYNNNAGTMMDRNLGATSATPGDTGSLGLLYQWGRKDPFLGSSSISSSSITKSTFSWPSPVRSVSATGTISYSVANPVTFIAYNSYNYDWYYTGNGETDNTRWQSTKTIYDPCPPGYRVPDGDDRGVWSTAFGSSYLEDNSYDNTNEGFNLGASGKGTYKLSSKVSTCWYPAAGSLFFGGGSLSYVGLAGSYWSCSPNGYFASNLYLYDDGYIYPAGDSYRAYGYSVRCVKE